MAIEFPEQIGSITYEFDYFAGSAVMVYAEDILLDDCVRIGFNIQQSRKPIWGYASQYYNALASGVVMVSGSFWIAFKEAGYLPIILTWLAQRRSETEEDLDFFASPASSPASGGNHASSLARSTEMWQGGGQAGRVRRAGVERLTAAGDTDDQSRETAAALNNVLTQLGALNDQEFESLAEDFEDAVWYGGNRTGSGREGVFTDNLGNRSLDPANEQFLAYRRPDQFPPFDLIVTFGDINTGAANHTVKRLMDVTITGEEFSGIEASGDPIMVRYDFIGRNIM